MHKSAKRIFITIIALSLLAIAFLGVNFLFTGFYEARFYLPIPYYKQLNTVLTLPDFNVNAAGLPQKKRPFIDEFLPGHSLSELFASYATIQQSASWVVIKVYAKNASAINDLNRLIQLQYKDVITAKNTQALEELAQKLVSINEQITAQISSIHNGMHNGMHNGTVTGEAIATGEAIERAAADKYIESFIAAAQSGELVRYLQSLNNNREAYLAVPAIAKYDKIKQLVAAEHYANIQLRKLKSMRRRDYDEIAHLGNELAAIETQINLQIKARITYLENQAKLDRNLETRLKQFLSEKSTANLNLDSQLVNLENLFQQKLEIQLKQQSLLNRPSANNNMIIASVHPQIEDSWLLVLLMPLLVLSIAATILYDKLYSKLSDKLYRHKNQSKENNAIDFSSLAQQLTGKPHGAVAFFAQQAETAAAKFIMYLRKIVGSRSRILILDFSGKVIDKYTDSKVGIKDLLVQNIDLSQAIYHDTSIDIDIIMADNIGELDTQEKRQKFNYIMINCYQNYDLIIYCVSEEVEIPINSFLAKETIIVVVSSAFNDCDAKNWAKVLRNVGFRAINFLRLL